MGRPPLLSGAQLDEMADLREQGWSYSRIAAHFTQGGTRVSAGAIGWQCLRLGIDLPPEKRSPIGKPCLGRGRSFTPDEDARLLAQEATGARICEMARALGRGSNSVIGRLATLARIQARAEGETVNG